MRLHIISLLSISTCLASATLSAPIGLLMTEQNDIETILDQLESRYDASVDRLRKALTEYAERGVRPDPKDRDDGAFAYPELRIEYDPETPPPTPGAGLRPAEPARHLHHLDRPPRPVPRLSARTARTSGPRLSGRGQRRHIGQRNPLSLCARRQRPRPCRAFRPSELSRWFPSTDLVHIGDEVADGAWDVALDPTRPLALFDALRTDFSLARLKHYTGTPAEHFQRFVLFTNYVRYVDEFVRFAIAALRDPASRFTALSVPGGTFEHGDLADAEEQIAAGVWRRHQMPAYHLMTPDGDGITLVNIGVGPSQRQDDLRPYRGAAARSLADDRPLRRPSPQPDDRRLCPRPRLSARRPCARRRAAGRSPDPGHRRGPDRALQRGARGHGRG